MFDVAGQPTAAAEAAVHSLEEGPAGEFGAVASENFDLGAPFFGQISKTSAECAVEALVG